MKLTRIAINATIAAALAAAVLFLAGQSAFAQNTTSQDYVPTRGGGTTTYALAGGANIIYPGTVYNGKPATSILVRPGGGPDASEFSAVAEFETWKNDLGAGVFKGNRQTILTGYSKESGNNNEISGVLPYEFVHIDGVGQSDRFDDAEVNYRHYSFDDSDPKSLTTVYGAKLVLPTGSAGDFIGLGRWGLGPEVTVSKPWGNSLAYVGANYTVIARKAGDYLSNPYFLWLGGVTALQPKTILQYEITKFRSDNGEGTNYTRILVGPRFAITPTAGIQVNIKQEIEAASRSTVFSIGYSNRM